MTIYLSNILYILTGIQYIIYLGNILCCQAIFFVVSHKIFII